MRVSDKLLVAESLNPQRSVAQHACTLCGHLKRGAGGAEDIADLLRVHEQPAWDTSTFDPDDNEWVRIDVDVRANALSGLSEADLIDLLGHLAHQAAVTLAEYAKPAETHAWAEHMIDGDSALCVADFPRTSWKSKLGLVS